MIAAVIPCYRVRKHILGVLSSIGPECEVVYVVDDACPEGTGEVVEAECHDPRVRVIYHPENQGVGGATLTGYRAALADGATIIVKLDGDGQMDPARIPMLLQPLLDGEADYVKGNRFFDLEGLGAMPPVRVFGNSVLSLASKLSTGYWDLFDPTNGFTAIHGIVLRQLALEKLDRGWFFESDLLFNLGILRAVAQDVPMPAIYGEERSSLREHHVVLEFALKHTANTFKRIFYNYYLRSFNIASIEIVAGLALLVFGTAVGIRHWIESSVRNIPATSGTVMLAALPVLIGVQLVLAFLNFDLRNVPRRPLHRRLRALRPGS